MRNALILFCASFFLPPMLFGAADADSLLTDDDVVVKPGPNFDIPPEATTWPYGREKHFCSCRRDEDPADAWCYQRPMYYLIKVQNWGDEEAYNVMVIDDLPSEVAYVPSTTEMATWFDENGDGTNWDQIADKSGNGSDDNTKFPLSGEGYKVADTMTVCNQTTLTCEDTRLIRFMVVPNPGLSKNVLISNHAFIKEAVSPDVYYTNTNMDLTLSMGTCIEQAWCYAPEKAYCGGVYIYRGDCCEGIICPECYECDPGTCTCVPDPICWCGDMGDIVRVSYDIGFNSPGDYGSPTIVPAGTKDLVIGQFKINAPNCVNTEIYGFVSVFIRVDKKDTKVVVDDLKLIYDKNANGILDADEEVVGTAVSFPGNVAYFTLDQEKYHFTGSEWHYFIILGTVGYDGEQVPVDAVFHIAIEGPDSFSFESVGGGEVDGDPIDFPEFQIEPDGPYFIVTRGLNDPKTQPADQLQRDIPMLQLRTKAVDASNRINRLVVSVVGNHVPFGDKERIKSVSLYLDTDGDGVADGEPIAKTTEFDDQTEAVFEGEMIEQSLNYGAGKEIFLIVNCDLSKVPDMALQNDGVQIEVKRGGVLVQDTARRVEGLPVQSKEFFGDPFPDADIVPDADTKKDGGCGCSMVW